MIATLKAEEQSQLQLVEREDIDDEEDLFEAIDKLIAQGINAGDVKKLQDAGIYTCNGLMMHTKKRKQVVRITTGSQALDELLGGGIETLCITEAFGEFRSGKTQLAHTLCVSTQLPTNMRGGNGKVAYIDTEGTFRPDRIVPIAERFGMDPGAVLDNIIYARAYTYEHQYNLLLGLAAKMSEEPFRLLIVDSVIALFRVDFTGRGELAERQQKLAQMLSRLTKIAEEFNVAVYMTNQVIADPGGGVFISDPKKPAGGHVLAHAATIRLMFRKGKGEQRVCKVFDAPNLPEAEAISLVTVIVLLPFSHRKSSIGIKPNMFVGGRTLNHLGKMESHLIISQIIA
ncbi:meiotic recombination protein DMC1 homolog isoform X4 [Ricinus communis]|uniref:meiotic recombination protein DMC1 homolog isoform X4 n=1 Tax=Ricinus communis TaxID=3988 RepID=UPI00201AD4DB|nr:meiotic recombination protein DMC1 homolog isoform X4 [Ricinus communis]